MARRNLKPGALTAPLPPVLVTVGDMETSNMITIGWTGILATHPPKTYISVRKSRHSYAMLLEKREFVINLTTEDMAVAVDYAGIYTGMKVDKWQGTGLTPTESLEVSAPTVEESPLALECKVTDIVEMGSHDVFYADIVSVSCDERILDKDGRIMLDRAGLLAYAHGEYFALGEKLGKFGFSTNKENKEKRKKTEGCQEKEEKKPFYLTAPRGKSKGGRKRK